MLLSKNLVLIIKWFGMMMNELPKSDLVVLPGGFSYGDYLRCGSMASKSKIMQSVINFAKSGGLVMGICNGFQIFS